MSILLPSRKPFNTATTRTGSQPPSCAGRSYCLCAPVCGWVGFGVVVVSHQQMWLCMRRFRIERFDSIEADDGASTRGNDRIDGAARHNPSAATEVLTGRSSPSCDWARRKGGGGQQVHDSNVVLCDRRRT